MSAAVLSDSAIAVGLLVAGLAAVAIARGRRTMGWPSAEGRLVSYEPPRIMSRGDLPFVLAFGAPQPRVRYTYEVGGVRYTHSSVRVGPGAGTQTVPTTVGVHVRVYYDPHEPAHSILVAGTSRWPYYQMALALALLGLGLYTLVG